MASSFLPKGQEGILLRSPLTHGFTLPPYVRKPKPIYSKETDMTYVLGNKDREVLTRRPQVGIAYYTRNNPHPTRVIHMKGLLDVPICCVEDHVQPRYLLSAPSSLEMEPRFRPTGCTRYSANVNKGIPAIGIVPVTNSWREELEKKTQNAILRAMGQQIPPHSRDDQTGTGKENQFDHFQDEKVDNYSNMKILYKTLPVRARGINGSLLELLCCILQTDSIPVCLAWLSTASDTEKIIVLNMIKMAACGELPEYSSRHPGTSESQFRYVWAPDKSHAHKSYADKYGSDKFNSPYKNKKLNVGGLNEVDDDVTFKLPAHDTIVKTARQLSRLVSRNGSKASAEVFKELNTQSFISKGVNNKKPIQKKEKPNIFTVDASTSTTHLKEKPTTRRAKSRSVQKEIHLPSVHTKVSMTKDEGKGGGTPRLKYTSHWGM